MSSAFEVKLNSAGFPVFIRKGEKWEEPAPVATTSTTAAVPAADAHKGKLIL